MQVSSQEIQELQSFISTLNLQTNSVVVVEGKRDAAARVGRTGRGAARKERRAGRPPPVGPLEAARVKDRARAP